MSRSRRKTLLFVILTLLLIPLLVEISLHLVYAATHRRLFPFEEYAEAMDDVADFNPAEERIPDNAGAVELADFMGNDVLHPFIGYVVDPRRHPDASYLGFPQKHDDPLTPAGEDVLTVLVVGGSFAQGVSTLGETAMQSTLAERGIQARVITAAMGGYKQPQQLTTVAFLLSLGADIDVVVNIDGFNEVALPPFNHQVRVNPFYPRAWNQRVAGRIHPATLRHAGRIWILQDRRRRRAEVFQALPKYSIVRNILWRSLDAQTARRIQEIEQAFQESAPRSKAGFMHRGPELEMESGDDLFRALVDHWVRSSVLLNSLCEGQGIVYLHALQPNQYYEAGRMLTPHEREVAYEEKHPYRPGVVQGYPLLIEAGQTLLSAGVDFQDLTMIYKDVKAPVYADTCCHANHLGYEIVGSAIAERIAEVLGRGEAERGVAEPPHTAHAGPES